MGKFLESEKLEQMKFRSSSPYFFDAARALGIYRRKERPFCLPLENAEENLFPAIRESALAYFSSHQVKWHDGHNGKPSNHLCDSQVCCVNFLFPFADQPLALAQVFRPFFPALQEMLPMEKTGEFVAFEWIGLEDYLNEKRDSHRRRTRGANCTSADAAVMFRQTDGKQRIVLIEWKYTEFYSGDDLKVSKSGRDRTKIYERLFNCDDCPMDKDRLPSYEALFFEPFYQFMRQQFLAHEMERARELEADLVSVLHISPARNQDFQKVTSPELESPGQSATSIWKDLVRPRDRFNSIETERLFGKLSGEDLPGMQAWLDYIFLRYPWVGGNGSPIS